jgi:hypothetical protein
MVRQSHPRNLSNDLPLPVRAALVSDVLRLRDLQTRHRDYQVLSYAGQLNLCWVERK